MAQLSNRLKQLSSDLQWLSEAADRGVRPQTIEQVIRSIVGESLSVNDSLEVIPPAAPKYSKTRQKIRYKIPLASQLVEIFAAEPDRTWTERELIRELRARHPENTYRGISQPVSTLVGAGLVVRTRRYGKNGPAKFAAARGTHK